MTPDTIARFDQRVPRYTSYPTAPHFTRAVDADVYGEWLAAVPPGAETSLYVHVPFCAELCLYCGCHTTVARRYGPIASYLEILGREIAEVSSRLSAPIRVARLHWGGGTPTILSPPDFVRLVERLRAGFQFGDDVEQAVEIDPRTISPEMVDALARAGVSRASLGVQTFDPLVQQTIRRIQPFQHTQQVVDDLRAVGIYALNFDLMYGLPFQTVDNVLDTVERALALDPSRIALFGYAHVPWMKRHQALLPEDVLPGPGERVAQFEAAARRIEGAGYVAIGLDHFAKADDALALALGAGELRRNFQGYTTDGAPVLIGLGTSAISALPQGYAQNASSTIEYRRAMAARRLATARGIELTGHDTLRREIIERLMCDLRVDLDEICSKHDAEPSLFSSELARVDELVGAGFVRRQGRMIIVPPSSRALVRNVCAVFDARLSSGPSPHGASL